MRRRRNRLTSLDLGGIFADPRHHSRPDHLLTRFPPNYRGPMVPSRTGVPRRTLRLFNRARSATVSLGLARRARRLRSPSELAASAALRRSPDPTCARRLRFASALARPRADPWRFLLAAGLATLGVLLVDLAAGWDQPVQAQNSLEQSDPADGQVLASSPREIRLTFTEPIGNANRLNIACEGDPFTAHGQPEVGDDGRTLVVEIVQPMPAGDCDVSWQVSETSGEPGIDGSFSFTVRAAPPTTPGGSTVPGPTSTTPIGAADAGADGDDEVLDASEASDGPTWLGRVLSTFGVAVLFGSLVLIVAAWPEGPEYIVAVRFLRSVWLIGLIGTLVYVVALTAAVNDESFGHGLNPSGWLDLLDAGWPGRAAVARLVLVLASGWVVLRPERVIDPTTQLPAIGIPALAVVTLGLSRTGGEWEVVGVIAGITHAAAMAIWVGAVVLLARVVLAGPGEEDLVHAVRGFTRISGSVIVVTIVSGLIQLYRLDGGELFSESHGRVLLLKTLLVAAMVFVALTAGQVVRTRLARASDLSVPMANRLRRAFGTQAVLGVGVLALSGWLLALEPGKLPAEEGPDFAVNETIVDPDADVDLTVSLDPGQVGMNRLRVEVSQPETGLSGLELTFIPPVGSDANEVVQRIPLTGAGIADSGTNGGVPLNVAGAWTLQVSARTATGSVTGAGSSFDVLEADGSVRTSDIGTSPTQPPVTAAPTTAPPPSTTS
jgi:copper transport protein